MKSVKFFPSRLTHSLSLCSTAVYSHIAQLAGDVPPCHVMSTTLFRSPLQPTQEMSAWTPKKQVAGPTLWRQEEQRRIVRRGYGVGIMLWPCWLSGVDDDDDDDEWQQERGTETEHKLPTWNADDKENDINSVGCEYGSRYSPDSPRLLLQLHQATVQLSVMLVTTYSGGATDPTHP